MIFPDVIPVQLVLRKKSEEQLDDCVWITYSFDSVPDLEIDLQIEHGSFGDEDLEAMRVALAEELLEKMVSALRRARTYISGFN